jgi:hypothetical protein
MAPKTKKSYSGKGKERPPPIDKLLLPAIGIGLALLLFQFFKGINSEVSLRLRVCLYYLYYYHIMLDVSSSTSRVLHL